MLDHQIPIWVGEFGPVYTGQVEPDAMRDRMLRDQLEIYKRHHASWAIWLYKDIGLQGLTYVAAESPWRQRIRSFVEKKARLGADAWGGRDTHIRHLIEPLEKTFAADFPNYNPGPYGGRDRIKRLVRNILLAEALLPEFAELFRGMSETAIDEMMQSFLFKNCVIRQPLAESLLCMRIESCGPASARRRQTHRGFERRRLHADEPPIVVRLQVGHGRAFCCGRIPQHGIRETCLPNDGHPVRLDQARLSRSVKVDSIHLT